MSLIRTPNHPAAFTGHFAPLEDSSVDTVRANQYGYVKTPSFFQCSGLECDKRENFEVQLLTNSALNNTLSHNSIYAISGKLIAMNDGSTPILSYAHETVTRIGENGSDQPDFNSKTNVSSLGMVVDRREIVSDHDTGTRLEVTVAHCDWDAEQRCHRRFNIKYVVPGTKNLIKTHTLYQVGREVFIIGRLVDFDMDGQMAVVLVSSVSITNGHQVGRNATTSTPNVACSNGLKITKFSPSPKKSPTYQSQPTQSTSKVPGNLTAASPPVNKTQHKAVGLSQAKSKSRNHPPQSNGEVNDASPTVHDPPRADCSIKGKTVNRSTSNNSDDDNEVFSNDEVTEEDEETEDEGATIQLAKPKRGRPRKAVLKEAAKRMKKY
ncbi:hypothetical protein, variant [Puccinia triticina 1-1 BBBD Race 1]|uniref:Uncharacterized protein n=1 Tax=Puccinia triticina (isolate 1-1 / race 1 (BBBD)) TaxID=630390 RepID=A0A180FZQ3_PUCT1|nr:hypothetical protein PTTG_09267 [Puccinia triticina 1-1 BBBD Race 1]OAV85860.1 hypothetical protein, variant [Puccinia triticina 1-1 BBBD Race 1]